MIGYKRVLDEVKAIDGSVSLVAVSKTKPISMIEEAYNEGARVFGENRVQEIEEKFTIYHPDDIKVYLIGHLQSNKAKKAVSLVDRIESVDSLKLLKLIEKECQKQGKTIEILLEANSSGEEQKSGYTDMKELYESAKYAYSSPVLIFRGLMTVGPLGFDKEKNKTAFDYTKRIFDDMKEKYGIDVLSMGMSADWKEAIESGSTEVRIGSSIFGERK